MRDPQPGARQTRRLSRLSVVRTDVEVAAAIRFTSPPAALMLGVGRLRLSRFGTAHTVETDGCRGPWRAKPSPAQALSSIAIHAVGTFRQAVSPQLQAGGAHVRDRSVMPTAELRGTFPADSERENSRPKRAPQRVFWEREGSYWTLRIRTSVPTST